jgi:hypothetical protein
LWSSENSPTKLSEKGFEQRSEHGFGRYEEGKGAEKSRLGVPQSCAIDSSEALRASPDRSQLPLWPTLYNPPPHYLLRSPLRRVLHYLCRPSQRSLHPVRSPAFPGVAGVHPQVGEVCEVFRREVQQNLDAFPVLDLCAVNPSFEHQPLSIYQEVSLAALDLLAAVIAALFSTYPGRVVLTDWLSTTPALG